ncbi:sigma-70 family RNA polymerase sigma factor [Rhodococcus sp. HNM0569]|uniref:sigma-70 family RNA polymerase sigma factor n=1 Tax=Rhodococcus sp. HNM0569 TaxID=2716340 RepID=UPI00146F5A36|nr:sigma-70 family RNA polymerase sigma factor [Rhodococcus sp. HNM0569]NLU83640.1 sigma-70 family RNA polymerase sigma factor [Rhodococcus sp. HNM0569]
MSTTDPLTSTFEQNRDHLRAVAYRMLGSLADAEDAVQDAWVRASTASVDGVENLAGWLTTVTSRVCLNMLRTRRTHPEQSLDDVHVPDPVLAPLDTHGPEHDAVQADSVSVALLVVLETLSPTERLVFVLHDLFAMPFEEIAPIVERTPAATRKLASRARARVQSGAPAPVPLAEQRRVVDAFLSAARGGDLDELMSVLAPDMVIRTDNARDELPRRIVGADAAARGAVTFQQFVERTRMLRLNDGIGVVSFKGGRVASVAAFAVADGRVVAMNIVADPERLAQWDLSCAYA